MKYVLLIHQGSTPTPLDPEAWSQVPPEQQQAIYAAYRRVNEQPELTPGAGLQHPDTATTVRVQDGQTVVTDGTYAELKDAVGGIAFVEAEDLDRAIEIAAMVPAAALGGGVEIRPVQEW